MFEIFASEDSGGFISVGTMSADSTSFIYADASENSEYVFRVDAVVSAQVPENSTSLISESNNTHAIYTTPAAPVLSLSSIGALAAY